MLRAQLLVEPELLLGFVFLASVDVRLAQPIVGIGDARIDVQLGHVFHKLIA